MLLLLLLFYVAVNAAVGSWERSLQAPALVLAVCTQRRECDALVGCIAAGYFWSTAGVILQVQA